MHVCTILHQFTWKFLSEISASTASGSEHCRLPLQTQSESCIICYVACCIVVRCPAELPAGVELFAHLHDGSVVARLSSELRGTHNNVGILACIHGAPARQARCHRFCTVGFVLSGHTIALPNCSRLNKGV
jgi:hypothetical protein